MVTVHLTEQQRRELWRMARFTERAAAAALAIACPTDRGLSDDPCPCHPKDRRP